MDSTVSTAGYCAVRQTVQLGVEKTTRDGRPSGAVPRAVQRPSAGVVRKPATPRPNHQRAKATVAVTVTAATVSRSAPGIPCRIRPAATSATMLHWCALRAVRSKRAVSMLAADIIDSIDRQTQQSEIASIDARRGAGQARVRISWVTVIPSGSNSGSSSLYRGITGLPGLVSSLEHGECIDWRGVAPELDSEDGSSSATDILPLADPDRRRDARGLPDRDRHATRCLVPATVPGRGRIP